MAPFRSYADWPPLDAWNAHAGGLRSAGGAAIRFVAQPPRRRGVAPDVANLYDERIFTKGEVPSRAATWHDFFNMLVWASFPATKCAINARQRRALRAWVDPAARRLPSARTREQDALAMIDEGGALIASRGPLAADDVPAAVARGEARVLLLGHAVYEHLVVSSGAVRAFPWVVETDAPFDDVDALRRDVDARLARALAEAPLDLRASRGLPVTDALFA
ncbi:MAG TPA: DUF3025 domain-containing protein [Polyangiaceae bacterium]|nr:DUF3025 domain-containing protein [Polyangiaceae bacterium]